MIPKSNRTDKELECCDITYDSCSCWCLFGKFHNCFKQPFIDLYKFSHANLSCLTTLQVFTLRYLVTHKERPRINHKNKAKELIIHKMSNMMRQEAALQNALPKPFSLLRKMESAISKSYSESKNGVKNDT